MTQEQINELLKPRYKVIALWPDAKYEVGHIFVCSEQFDSTYPDKMKNMPCTPFTNGKRLGSGHFELYPHLFRKLEWWEERKPEELPLYVKNAADGIVFKVEYNFNSNTPSDVHTWNEQFRIPFWHSLYDLLPATEADYNEYLQTLTHNQEP